jgi:hypothetical protein
MWNNKNVTTQSGPRGQLNCHGEFTIRRFPTVVAILLRTVSRRRLNTDE